MFLLLQLQLLLPLLSRRRQRRRTLRRHRRSRRHCRRQFREWSMGEGIPGKVRGSFVFVFIFVDSWAFGTKREKQGGGRVSLQERLAAAAKMEAKGRSRSPGVDGEGG